MLSTRLKATEKSNLNVHKVCEASTFNPLGGLRFESVRRDEVRRFVVAEAVHKSEKTRDHQAVHAHVHTDEDHVVADPDWKVKGVTPLLKSHVIDSGRKVDAAKFMGKLPKELFFLICLCYLYLYRYIYIFILP